MYNINTNIVTASKLIDRALEVADIANTDFLSYNEKIDYLNSSWKSVYQNIIQYNLNVFTVETNLIGSAGVYQLPWDCYQLKSVKNPITGIEIPRKADSESIFGSTYEIVNNTIRLGPSIGPVTITYWRKPFFLSVPDKTIITEYSSKIDEVLSVCKDALFVVDRATHSKYSIISLLTESRLEIPINPDNSYTGFILGNNFIIAKYFENLTEKYDILDFSADVIYVGNFSADYVVRADDGVVYFGNRDEEDETLVHFIYPTGESVMDIHFKEVPTSVICIDGLFYPVPNDAMPVGIFDDRPAFTTPRKLHLINESFDRSKDIVEEITIPTIGTLVCTKYGFVGFDGKLYSNVPDTELNFPNNIYYDCIAYDLAVRFLCKMNADSSGVENLNKSAWSLLTSSIDQSADFQRIKLVRR